MPEQARGSSGRKIRVSVKTELIDVYEVDVDTLLTDACFEDVALDAEALADRFDDWLVDAPEEWSKPWARKLQGHCEGWREVDEVIIEPIPETAT